MTFRGRASRMVTATDFRGTPDRGRITVNQIDREQAREGVDALAAANSRRFKAAP